MQTAQAFGQVQGALNWFVDAYPFLLDWRATVNRLTAFTIKSLGEPTLNLGVGEPEKIYATDEPGSGRVQDKTKIALAELIEKVNDLFEGDLTPGDKLVYVNDVIKGKLMESERLAEQAVYNTKEQFASSPDLASEIMSAVMDALAAHTVMSKQALESEKLRSDMKDVLLGAGKLWEGLREKSIRASISSSAADQLGGA